MKAAFLSAAALLFVAQLAHADVHSCSQPAHSCTSQDEVMLTIEGCSVTCPEGVAAICVEGDFMEPTATATCQVHTENKCYCAGDNRNVQQLGDHE